MTTLPSCVRWDEIDALLALALREDVGPGDITTNSLAPEDARMRARFVARQPGIVAGLEVLSRLYAQIDPSVEFSACKEDGNLIQPGDTLATAEGTARAILTAERLALNLLQRMSGVASLTREYVDAVASTQAKIYDTRKTLPGMRSLDKWAVLLGGAQNHRYGLYDMVLIKDNHLALMSPGCPQGSTSAAIRMARQKTDLPIMVEVDTMQQLTEAIDAEPDMILLDNMPPEILRQAISLVEKQTREKNLRRPELEASGGVNLETVRAIAETGVDRISVGALTHSAIALDIGLDFDD